VQYKDVSVRSLSEISVPLPLKGVGMKVFKGTFAVNFELSDYIGLGKPVLSGVEGSVSRGFGTIKRVGE
jgi:hypothetical protein